MMPMGFGGSESVDDAAWLGDKLLVLAMAKVLVENGVKGKDDLTRRQSALISNANLRWGDKQPTENFVSGGSFRRRSRF